MTRKSLLATQLTTFKPNFIIEKKKKKIQTTSETIPQVRKQKWVGVESLKWFRSIVISNVPDQWNNLRMKKKVGANDAGLIDVDAGFQYKRQSSRKFLLEVVTSATKAVLCKSYQFRLHFSIYTITKTGNWNAISLELSYNVTSQHSPNIQGKSTN